MRTHRQLLALLFAAVALGGCVGTRTFHEIARAGDTVALAAGPKRYFSRDNITVTITPSTGTPIVYLPNHPAVVASVNLYPDPVSSAIVSTETGLDQSPFARTYGSLTTSSLMSGDADWRDTVVFLNLPSSLPVGGSEISISNPQGEQVAVDVEIVEGIGRPNSFSTTFGPLSNYQIASLERAPHYAIRLSSTAIPYGVQVDLTHDPDADHGGAGKPYAVNPRGDLKNITWSDNGTSMRVLLTPAKAQTLTRLLDFKFYVAGGLNNVQVAGVRAFDSSGNPISGVTATIDQ